MRESKCDGCGTVTDVNYWTNDRKHSFAPRWRHGLRWYPKSGEYCAECFDSMGLPENHPMKTGGWSGPNDHEQGFDNVVRMIEDWLSGEPQL